MTNSISAGIDVWYKIYFIYQYCVTSCLNPEQNSYKRGKNSHLYWHWCMVSGVKTLPVLYMGIMWLGAGMLNGTDINGVKTLKCHLYWHWCMVHQGLSMAAFTYQHYMSCDGILNSKLIIKPPLPFSNSLRKALVFSFGNHLKVIPLDPIDSKSELVQVMT